ncbi:MAG: hypothetical protein QXU98_06910 [Candidatus Parvarchaeota archaeon]
MKLLKRLLVVVVLAFVILSAFSMDSSGTHSVNMVPISSIPAMATAYSTNVTNISAINNTTAALSLILNRIFEVVLMAVIAIAVIIGLVKTIPIMLGNPEDKRDALAGMKNWLIGMVIIVLLASGFLVGFLEGLLRFHV